LGKILGQDNGDSLNSEEIDLLKALVKRMKEKETSNAKRI